MNPIIAPSMLLPLLSYGHKSFEPYNQASASALLVPRSSRSCASSHSWLRGVPPLRKRLSTHPLPKALSSSSPESRAPGEVSKTPTRKPPSPRGSNEFEVDASHLSNSVNPTIVQNIEASEVVTQNLQERCRHAFSSEAQNLLEISDAQEPL